MDDNNLKIKRINSYEAGYEKGYWKAFLDIKNYFNDHDLFLLKSKRQTILFITSLCDYLLKNNLEMDKFRDYGGYVDMIISNKKENKGQVVCIKK